MDYNALNLDNYITCDINPVYEVGIANYQDPPRKLVNTYLRSRDFNSYMKRIMKFLDNAGFKLFTDA